MDALDCRSFGERNFAGLQLGDARRTERLVSLADQLLRHPGGTLPHKLPDPADLRAFYRLMRCPEVTHERLLAGHTALTRERMAACAAEGRVVLILHDATELDYTQLKSLKAQLGQIGQGTHRGYICQNSLAMQAEPPQVLGLASQILHHRPHVPKEETITQKRKRESRESRLWVRGVEQCGPRPAGQDTLVVDVSDSLSDTFEYMAWEVTQGRHFLLRSRENRKLEQAAGEQHYLYAAVRQQAAVATREVGVQATTKRAGRTASVAVSYTPVELALPGKQLGEYSRATLPMWAVRVWEPEPPEGAEPLEWILLTNVPVRSSDDALQRVQWYELRWVIEDYHKGMKTGCGIETLQFTTIDRLEPAIGMLSILATTLLQLRDAARQPDADERPATDLVSADYVRVLAAHYGSRLGARPSILKFFLHVARLGGHQNRKNDFPGWITLWRGWMKLQNMVLGYQASHARTRKCALT